MLTGKSLDAELQRLIASHAGWTDCNRIVKLAGTGKRDARGNYRHQFIETLQQFANLQVDFDVDENWNPLDQVVVAGNLAVDINNLTAAQLNVVGEVPEPLASEIAEDLKAERVWCAQLVLVQPPSLMRVEPEVTVLLYRMSRQAVDAAKGASGL
jgi:hypothetical protein